MDTMPGLHLFAGANTSKGFYSYYNFLALDSIKRVFILKGGPGTGKSTLLKEIAELFQHQYSVDRFHCSADVNSLDGVYIHGLDISLLDGTAPHVTDPRLPGAVQEIVDLGQCWNAQPLTAHRKTIQTLTYQISHQYQVAYKWLAIAAGQADLIQEIEKTPDLEKQAIEDAEKIACLLPQSASGQNRRAFASAITGSGIVNYLPEIKRSSKVNVYLIGGNRSYNQRVLSIISQILKERELPATYMYCGLSPEKLEHVCIPGEFGLYSTHRPHWVEAEENVFGPAEGSATWLQDQFFSTIDQAVAALAQAHHLHMELEKIYIPQVDFNCVDNRQKHILSVINALRH